MYLLGWSQTVLFNQKVYDRIQYEDTGLTYVKGADGISYIGIPVESSEGGKISKDAFESAVLRLEENAFGILKGREAVFYAINENENQEGT